ncbi:MAG: hypothetical protein ACYTKD_25060, partial [Planctomycetota bacterium]
PAGAGHGPTRAPGRGAAVGTAPTPGNASEGTNWDSYYWLNRHTNLVNDEPREAWLFPHEWGQLSFE